MKEERKIRLQALLKREISKIIMTKLRDKRLSGFVSITRVKLSPDARFAKVYILSYANKIREEKILDVLNNAKGFIRNYLAKDVNLRYTPNLMFFIDDAIREGDKVIKLLSNLEYGENK